MNISIDSLEAIRDPVFESTAINCEGTKARLIPSKVSKYGELEASEKSYHWRNDVAASEPLSHHEHIPVALTHPDNTIHFSQKVSRTITPPLASTNSQDSLSESNHSDTLVVRQNTEFEHHEEVPSHQFEPNLKLFSFVHHASVNLQEPQPPNLGMTAMKQNPVVKAKISPCSQIMREVSPTTVHSQLHQAKNVPSSWEKWMVRKAEEERHKREKIKRELLLRREHEIQQRKAMELKREKAVKVHAEWVKQKNMQDRAKKVEQQKEKIAQAKLQEQKKQAMLEKAAASYNQWYRKTEEERIQKIQKNKEIAKLKALRERELRQKSELAYKVWLNTVGNKRIHREPFSPMNAFTLSWR